MKIAWKVYKSGFLRVIELTEYIHTYIHTYICIYIYDLLGLLTGYGPANPTMATHDQNVQESSSRCRHWMSHLVFSICQNPEVVGSNAGEGIQLLRRRARASKEQSFLLPCPYEKHDPD